jgi:hypothetical protein
LQLVEVEVEVESGEDSNQQGAHLYHSSKLALSVVQLAGSSFGGDGKGYLLLVPRQQGVLPRDQHQGRLSSYDVSCGGCWKTRSRLPSCSRKNCHQPLCCYRRMYRSFLLGEKFRRRSSLSPSLFVSSVTACPECQPLFQLYLMMKYL